MLTLTELSWATWRLAQGPNAETISLFVPAFFLEVPLMWWQYKTAGGSQRIKYVWVEIAVIFCWRVARKLEVLKYSVCCGDGVSCLQLLSEFRWQRNEFEQDAIHKLHVIMCHLLCQKFGVSSFSRLQVSLPVLRQSLNFITLFLLHPLYYNAICPCSSWSDSRVLLIKLPF